MLEICISGFLVTSVAVSLLLWRALAAAKQADDRLRGIDSIYRSEPAEEQVHRMKLVPSAND